MRGRLIFAVLAGNALMLSSATHAAAATPPPAAAEKVADDRPKYDPEEPLAQTFSLEKERGLPGRHRRILVEERAKLPPKEAILSVCTPVEPATRTLRT